MRNRLELGFIADGNKNLLQAGEVSTLGLRHTTSGLTRNVQAVFVIAALLLLMSSAWGQTAPTISSISPTVGPPSPVGPSVTLHGANFGAAQGTSTVTFGGISATPSSWNDTAIVVPVPSSLAAGNADIAVAVNGSSSNTQTFVVIPVITGVSPGSAPIGASVTINGAGFGTITSAVTFNGTIATPSTWTARSVTVPVPTGASTGNLIVTVNSIATNQVSFTVLPPQPSITSISPTVGPPSPVGSSLTIRGTNFGSAQGASSVTIAGITGNPSSWSNTTIVVPVPSSLPAGSADVVVRITGGTSNAKSFFAIPVITGISPNPAPIGAPVTISGAGFGTVASALTFNGTSGTPSSWSGTSIVAPVPTGATTGSVVATVNGFSTNGATLTVSVPPPPPPSIAGVSPTSGSAGAVVSISGSHFGSTQGTGLVRIGGGGGTADVSTWSDTAITVTVPNTATSGPLLVVVNNQVSNGVDFTAPPVIGSLSPSSGVAGTLMTINGTNFGGAQGSNAISIAGIPATANSWTTTSIQVPVPSGAPTGDVLVTVNSVPSNPSTFVFNPANGLVTSFRYDSTGQLISIADPMNHTTSFTYTTSTSVPAGLVETISDTLSNITHFQYDAAGNKTAVIDALQNTTSYAYDARNRLFRVTFPDNSTNSFSYDIRGRQVSFTDGDGKVTNNAYDDGDRLVAVTDANNGVTSYAYDSDNDLTGVADALQRHTTFTYDEHGNVLQMVFPTGLTESYTYDAIGNLLTKTDRKHQTIQYSYDALNRLVLKQYPDGTGINYGYDIASRMTSITDGTGTYGFTFDAIGRLTGTTTRYAFVPGKTFTTTYNYDAASNRTSFTAPDGSTTIYVYDELNRLSTLANSLTGQFTLNYDTLSRRASINRPNGVNTTYSYDSMSRFLNILHKTDSVTVDGASYTYDSSGTRASRTSYPSNITEQYSYDPIYQLTQVIQGNTTTESYSYDLVGNRLTSSGLSPYSYDLSNQLTAVSGSLSFTYDSNGNTLTKTDSGGTRMYGWDFENRLTSVTLPGSGGTASFKYDPFGRRIQKVFAGVTTNYLYDGDVSVEEIDPTGAAQALYTLGVGTDEPLAKLHNATVEYYHQDGLGSVSSLTSASGILVGSYSYDTFGRRAASTPVAGNALEYTGRDYDSETGLRYYRARYYDPETGRFLSEDPTGFHGGINFYSYVHNNPVNFIDPSGLKLVPQPSQNPQDTVDYSSALKYLQNDSVAASMIADLERRQRVFNVEFIHDGNDRFNPINSTIYWDPRNGLKCERGIIQTPALGLFHEMSHAAGDGPRGRQLAATADAQYYTREERRVIRTYEVPFALRHGEGIRHNHGGEPIDVRGPVSRIPVPDSSPVLPPPPLIF